MNSLTHMVLEAAAHAAKGGNASSVHAAAAAAPGTASVKIDAIAQTYGKDLPGQVAALSAALEVVHSSWLGNRVELKHVLKEAAGAELRAAELFAELQQLRSAVALPVELMNLSAPTIRNKNSKAAPAPSSSTSTTSTTGHGVDNSSTEVVVTQLCAMLEQTRRDLRLTQEENVRFDEQVQTMGKEMGVLRAEVVRLTDDVHAAQAAKSDLIAVTRKQTRDAEARALALTQSVVQKLSEERLRVLDKVRSAEDLEMSLQRLKAARESEQLKRLKKEARESRRAADARAREVTFLQEQLSEAAELIVRLKRGGGGSSHYPPGGGGGREGTV
jgi:hypothetical protein